MKQIEKIAQGANYAAINVGRISEIIEHELPMGPDFTIQGKVFGGQAVGAAASEFSFQTLVPGQDSGFLHTHKTHEELYFILRGEGQYQVDGEIFPVSEGGPDDALHPVQGHPVHRGRQPHDRRHHPAGTPQLVKHTCRQ